MAVGRLSGAWIWEVIRTAYPKGVVRRVLLDEFAAILVRPRSRGPAKARLARRLYARLASLQRRGFITQDEGIIRPHATAPVPKAEQLPLLGPILQKLLFLAMLAEDGQAEAPDAPRLRKLRRDFLARAVEEGWTLLQAATALGLSKAKALDQLR
jgi:hypothetical protein